MNIAKLQDATQRLWNHAKNPVTHAKVKHSIKFGAKILGCVAFESLGKDPRRIGCQMAFMKLNLGLTSRLLDVTAMHEYVRDMNAVPLPLSVIKAYGNISPELRDRCFKPELVSKADLRYPIIVDRDTLVILDGRHRYAKAEQLGQDTIPCILIDHTKLPYAERSAITNEISFHNL